MMQEISQTVDTRIVATIEGEWTFDGGAKIVTSISDYFSDIEVDGVSVSLTDLANNTGKYELTTDITHVIKYTLIDPTSIGSNLFNNCNIETVTLPNTVTSIGYSAFMGCDELYDITLSETLTSIGDMAFQNCYLTNIVFPNSLETIGTNAFYANKFSTVTIPENVTYIGENAFNTSSRTLPSSLTCLAATPPTLGGQERILYARATPPIYVPTESVDAYKAAWWRYTSYIQAIP